jgi:hypothetical protein
MCAYAQSPGGPLQPLAVSLKDEVVAKLASSLQKKLVLLRVAAQCLAPPQQGQGGLGRGSALAKVVAVSVSGGWPAGHLEQFAGHLAAAPCCLHLDAGGVHVGPRTLAALHSRVDELSQEATLMGTGGPSSRGPPGGGPAAFWGLRELRLQGQHWFEGSDEAAAAARVLTRMLAAGLQVLVLDDAGDGLTPEVLGAAVAKESPEAVAAKAGGQGGGRPVQRLLSRGPSLAWPSLVRHGEEAGAARTDGEQEWCGGVMV